MYRFALLSSLVASACAPSSGDGLRDPSAVRAAVTAAVQQGPGTELRLATVTPFAWRRVYIFAPYTPLNLLRDSLRLRTLGDAERLGRGIDGRDDMTLLVFTFAQGTQASMELPRFPVDFGPELVGRSYGPEDAVFRVRQPPAGSWGTLGPMS
jgi:hypothetical protein